MIVKGHEIGSGMPLICVPVVERYRNAFLTRVNNLVAGGCEMIEWRADYYEGSPNPDKIKEVLDGLPKMNDTIFLFTFRTLSQGGRLSVKRELVDSIIMNAAQSESVDMVDIETFETDDAPDMVRRVHGMGKRVIASQHDFMKTPASEEMYDMLIQMMMTGADIVKLAVTPENADDALKVLHVTTRFHEKYPKVPVVGISMGRSGLITRITGELFGSAITFASEGLSSAPGQIPAKNMKVILNAVHKLMEE